MEALFCGSKDYFDSILSETHFCTLSGTYNNNNIVIAIAIANNFQLSGMVYVYGSLQACCWITIMTLAIFWAITFPFHYERFKASGRLKYFHITAVVLAITLPAIPALALLRDGYHISRFPFCTGRSLNTIFYGFVLPFSILCGTTTTLMVIASWNMFKVCQIINLSA